MSWAHRPEEDFQSASRTPLFNLTALFPPSFSVYVRRKSSQGSICFLAVEQLGGCSLDWHKPERVCEGGKVLPGRGEGRQREREQTWPWPKTLTLEALSFGSQHRAGWMGTDGVIDGGGPWQRVSLIHFFCFTWGRPLWSFSPSINWTKRLTVGLLPSRAMQHACLPLSASVGRGSLWVISSHAVYSASLTIYWSVENSPQNRKGRIS